VDVVRNDLGLPLVEGDAPADSVRTVIVVGGGTLMDAVKLWRWRDHRDVRIVAIPSLWGSGAEASPVALELVNDTKHIEMDDELLPDARAVWPELAASIPEPVALHACGDVWAHALEGFLSPLADDALREELAALMANMLRLPLGNDSAWYEASASACAGQARSSVGLVHGIAHTLEGPLREALPEHGFGHAKLCAVFLWPVMRFNQQVSKKWDEHTAKYGVDTEAVMAVVRQLHEPIAYDIALPHLEIHWRSILRDPATRTNSALVRPNHLSMFLERCCE
jgi:alcohol dehydrogenase class IV